MIKLLGVMIQTTDNYLESLDHKTFVRQEQDVSLLFGEAKVNVTQDFTNFKIGAQDPSVFKVDVTQCSQKQGGGRCGDCSQNSGFKTLSHRWRKRQMRKIGKSMLHRKHH